MQMKNKNIILRYIKEEDINDYIRWTTVETEWNKWDAPWEDDDFGEFVEWRRDDLKITPKKFSRLEIDTITGQHIGWVTTYFIDKTKEKTGVGIDIPSITDRGKGYGENALSLFMAYLFNTEETLYTQTWSGNNPMLKLAKKIGFIEVERNKNYRMVRGEYYDGLTFSISKKDFFIKYVDLLSIDESNKQ
jgi:RimJ/RimL family protein N-acetyltransferase